MPASSQCENGYTRLANEIIEALMRTGRVAESCALEMLPFWSPQEAISRHFNISRASLRSLPGNPNVRFNEGELETVDRYRSQ
jgi:hypothetical protein